MASSFFALFDDIAMLMDDIAVMGKVAMKKTAGVTGDDFAVAANQVNGVDPNRELPVIWRIIKGSLRNKLYLLVILLAVSYFSPVGITALLILGGFYLAYEGSEKVLETFGMTVDDHGQLTQTEDEKIAGALYTDMVLSAEIMIIALSTVITAPFLMQVSVLASVAVAITFIIYGLVALLIRLDDMGLALIKTKKPVLIKIGLVLVTAAPRIMRILSVVGTVAMLMVAGGIFMHNIEYLNSYFAIIVALIGNLLSEVVIGFTVGAALVAVNVLVNKVKEHYEN